MNDSLTTAQDALKDVRRQIAVLSAQHMSLGQDLGDALSKARLGDKKANAEAGKISMRRAGVDTERERLRLEETALVARVQQLEAGEGARRRDAALADLERITAEVAEAQETFARQMLAAGETGKRLNELGQEWQNARKTAGQLRGDVTAYPKAPAQPARLLHTSVLDDPAREVAIWKYANIDPATVVPPRQLTPSEMERKRGQKLEQEARDRDRKDRGDGVFHVISSMIRERGGAA